MHSTSPTSRGVIRGLLGLGCWIVVETGRPEGGHAALRHVPAAYPTPQAAVAAAANGDTVLIAPGTYTGGIWVNGKAVTIASWFATTGDTSYITSTVLDTFIVNACGGASGCAGNAVVEFGSSAGGSRVVGLTAQRGKDGVRGYSQVDISWCRLIGNEDGADFQTGGRGTFSNTEFVQNYDDGIDLNAQVALTITNCTIADNADDGIEFRLYPYSGALLRVDIVGNRFLRNDSDAIQLIDSPDSSSREVKIERNLFVSNRKATVGCMPDQRTDEDFSGAPIHETVRFVNNTVVGDGYGFVGGQNSVVVNNIFTGVVHSALRKLVGNSIASYNLLWNNGTNVDSSNVDMATTLLANPLLDAQHRLGAGSPAIDAGTASFVWKGVDVVGLPPTGYSGSAPDLGAYERVSTGAPVARDDSTQVLKGGTVSVPAPGMLANDTDPDSHPLTVTAIVTPPTRGSLTWSANGSFSYTHNNDNGTLDQFVYRIGDGTGLFAQATVKIKIVPPNGPPVAAADNFLVDINCVQDGLDVLGNDTDPDAGDVLTLLALDTSGTIGTAVISGDLVSYTAAPGYFGNDSFTYTMRDLQGLTSSATVSVSVQDMNVIQVSAKVNVGSDDAEESAAGAVTVSSGDLEMTWDGSEQKVGMRFTPLAVPRGAMVRKAWVQFKVDEVWPDATTLAIRAQAADHAPTFATGAGNLSARPTTKRAVTWVPPLWNTVDMAGPDQRTPNLTGLISEVVNRAGWASGNALAILVTGTGRRVAKAYESDAPGAPALVVEYVVPGPVAVEPGAAPGLALHGTRALSGGLRVDFSLPLDAPATLEVIDLAGRRVASAEVGTFGAGRHVVELGAGLRPSVYLVRVTQGAEARVRKAVFVR